MLIYLVKYLSQYWHPLNAFQYLTVRAIFSSITALLVSLMIGPGLIERLTRHKIGQIIRTCGPQTHLIKSGTPTMGGTLILSAMTVSTLLWANLNNPYIWLILLVTIGFGAIGFVDDYLKLTQKNTQGLPAKWKYFWQSLLGLGAATFLYFSASTPTETTLFFPFFKQLGINLHWLFIFWGYFIIVGSSNAVNLTDGLDGLAILPVVMIGSALAVFAYLIGNVIFSKYLFIPHIVGVGELTIFCASMTGAGLGFLWFNTYPAQVIMGDVGALSLGAALGAIGLILRQELVLAIMSGIFILETISVMLQILSFRYLHKRMFLMAPIHHHFELKGWAEPKIIVRFWIITFVLVLLGLATLKLR